MILFHWSTSEPVDFGPPFDFFGLFDIMDAKNSGDLFWVSISILRGFETTKRRCPHLIVTNSRRLWIFSWWKVFRGNFSATNAPKEICLRNDRISIAQDYPSCCPIQVCMMLLELRVSPDHAINTTSTKKTPPYSSLLLDMWSCKFLGKKTHYTYLILQPEKCPLLYIGGLFKGFVVHC